MKPRDSLVLLLFVVSSAFAQAAEQRSIRVAMDNNYPPFAFRDDEGKLQGILVDEWRLWERQTGIKVELHALDWDEAVRRMKAGEFDVIDTVFKTRERTAYWDFSKPYARIKVPVFFRKDISGIAGLRSLKGFPVAAKAGDAAADLLKESGITTLLLFTNYEAIAQAAKEHKVNVLVADQPPALYFLNKLGIQDEFRQSDPVSVGQFHRAVQKGNTALLKAIEAGFAALDPAELKRIEETWYGKAVGDHPNLRYLGYAAVAALSLIVGLAVWNLTLNRLVRRRTGALRESEEKYRSIFENAPVGIFQSTISGQLLSVNAAGVRMFGYDSADSFRAAATDMSRQLFVSSEQRDSIVREALGSERFARHEAEYRRKDGSVFIANLYLRAVRGEQGEPVFVEGFVEDISQRKRAEGELRRTNRTLRLLSECNELLVRATNETELLQAVCRLVVEVGGYRMAWVGFAEHDEARSVRPVAQAGFETGYLETASITWGDTERGHGPTGNAIRTGQPVIARHILTDPVFAPWREGALNRGYAASATLPLKRDERVLGALMVYAGEPDTFDAGEVELLTQLAGDLAYGLSALRTRTEQKEALEALRESEQRFRLIMDNLADLVAMLDLGGHRVYNSPSYGDILGDPDQLRGTSSFVEVHPEDRQRVEQAFQETVRTGIGKMLEYRMIDRTGRARHIESHGSVIRDEQGRVSKVVVVSRDVTERKRAEEELRRLSVHLLQVQDLERRHLARELHDTTAQHLAALTLDLTNLKGLLSQTSEPARALCSDCIQLANQAALEIRTHSYLLHPPLLEAMGLAGAVEDYAQGFSARCGIAVALEAPEDFGRLPEDMELALFRVVQESLTNVLRHSGSKRARIRFTRQTQLVTLEIQDMGQGIPADKLARIKAMSGGSGVGLGGMQQRLRLMGGRLDIESGPSGTTVRATVPVADPAAPSTAPA